MENKNVYYPTKEQISDCQQIFQNKQEVNQKQNRSQKAWVKYRGKSLSIKTTQHKHIYKTNETQNNQCMMINSDSKRPGT